MIALSRRDASEAYVRSSEEIRSGGETLFNTSGFSLVLVCFAESLGEEESQRNNAYF